MGNIECCVGKRTKESSFSESELKYLQNLYNGLIESNKASKKPNLNKEAFKALFAENPDIAEAIYHFIGYVSGDISKIDFKSFEYAVEVLTKEPTVIQLKDFKDREKIDVLALLVVQDFTLSKDKLNSMEVNHSQACQFVKCLLAILNCEKKESQLSDSVVRVVVDGSFKKDQGEVYWWNFLQYIKENLIYANRSLKAYFNMKFLGKKANLKVPEMSRTSKLLKDGFLSLLFFSNILAQTTPKLHLIYSSNNKDLSFKRMSQSLENSDVPTYIIMKVIPIEEGQGQGDCKNYDDEEGFVIGGFSKIPWKSTGSYRGDCDGYLFSLAPKFKNCFAMTKTTANPNYILMKAETDNEPGIGFGGINQNDFRIWINGNDFDKSYVRSQDKTYSTGKLVEPSPSSIKILEIEIWGFGVELLNLDSNFSLQKYSSAPTNSSAPWITFNQSKLSELLLMEVSPELESTPSNASFRRSSKKKISGLSSSSHSKKSKLNTKKE